MLSPIGKSDFWDQGKLIETIRWLNGDDEVRGLVDTFRSERREIIGNAFVDLTTYHNCCQILIDEIEDLVKSKLHLDWTKY